MNHLSPLRRRSALMALACGGFAIGLTEFAAMGLLPQMAQDLLAEQYKYSADQAIGQAGWLISAYALGVVVGAPTIATLGARLPLKRLLIGLLGLFVVATTASALAPTFELALVGRFVAGLPHGAYFGAAGLMASRLIGGNRHARGFSLVLMGLTVAGVIGVPLVTFLGQATNWRLASLVMSAAFAVTFAAVALLVPSVGAAGTASPRTELRSLRSGQVWLAAGIAAIGFAGYMTVYTYASPIAQTLTGLSEGTVPWVLATAGLGMTTGNALGGMAADRYLRQSLLGGFAALIGSGLLFWRFADQPVGLFTGVFLIAATSMFLGPALQARLIEAAPRAQLMGAALNQSATNVANSLGAWLGGSLIAHGLGYRAPALACAALAGCGLAMTLFSYRRRAVGPAEPSTQRPVTATLPLPTPATGPLPVLTLAGDI